MPPQTRFTRSGNVHIAYQVVGEGPLDLVFVPGWVSHVELMWEEPTRASFLVAAAANADETLVSSTVKDLVTGSGIAFADRGAHTLKGIPGEWRLYAASG